MAAMGRLIQQEADGQAIVYELSDPFLIGRARECQIHIQDITVSRRHARIRQLGEGTVIEDLGSNLGTRVNGRLIHRPRLLLPHDTIQISTYLFRYEETAATVPWESVSCEAHIIQTVEANADLADPAQGFNSDEAVRHLSRRLKALYAIAEAVSSTLNLDELLREILERLFEVFLNAERACVMLSEESELVLRSFKTRDPSAQQAFSVSRTILHEVLAKKRAALSHNAMEDHRFREGESVANMRIRAMMAAPLMWRDATLGILYVDSTGVASFGLADLELMMGIARQSAAALGNARLHRELLKRQRLQQDLRMAERIQQSFLPQTIPSREGYVFAASYEPAFDVGGDFYDFIELPEGQLGVVIGDVSGKGVSAALYMARFTRDLRYVALTEPDPAEVLRKMNPLLLQSQQEDVFLTLIYAVLNTKTHTLALANAGHMPVRVRQASGATISLEESGLPLGVLEDSPYQTQLYPLLPGDMALFYTDGLVEAMSPGHEMFGDARLTETMTASPPDAAAMLETLLQRVKQHAEHSPQFDDTTVVSLGRLPLASAKRG